MPPNDSGPIYTETLMGRFPVEPWNTASNLFFLLIVIYWAIKVYRYFPKYAFIRWTLPVLFIGYIGGTVYHATRSHELWLLLDWVPILLLCMAVSAYYAFKQQFPKWLIVLLITLPIVLTFGLRYLYVNQFIPRVTGHLINYSLYALVILLPLMRYLASQSWRNGKWVVLAILAFLIALIFRSLDRVLLLSFLPMGTHWLWHCFGAGAAHFLLVYIYREN